jgi:4-alpha-glucanotransferase
MKLSPNDKIAGVLAPLFALRTEDDLGIGDVAALRQFIGWVRGIGFKLVQLLPINESGGDNSPYNAISSRAIDPTTLHLAPGVPEDLSAPSARVPARVRRARVPRAVRMRMKPPVP